MNKYFLNIVLIFVFWVVSAVNASEAEVITTSSVDRSIITIGDRIHYRIDIAYPEGTEVKAPGMGIHLGEFEVKDYNIGEPEKEKDGKIHVSYEYVISTFTTGDYTIPPVEIVYMTPDSVVSGVYTDKIDIKVKSVKPSESGDIKDIKQPVNISGGLDWWWWLAIGTAAFIGFVAGAWYLFRNRKKTKQDVPPKPPYETAIEELDRLMSDNLIEKGQVKQFYFQLSEIIRRYLGGIYKFNAIDLTTFELLDKLLSVSVSENLHKTIEKFSIDSDLVKFADYQPSLPENREIIELARNILADSRPQVVAQEEKKAPENKENNNKGEDTKK